MYPIKHARTAAAVLFALATVSAPSIAAEYYLVVPTPGRTGAPPAQNISVTLNPYTLPDGIVGQAYAGFDLNAALQVTGDEAFDAAQVGWSLDGSMLPEGLSLTPSGAIAGTPTTATDAAGLLFSVLATYKGVQGGQGYRIAVAAPAAPPGEHLFTAVGTHSFTVPAGVTSISAVAVGGGGGGSYGGSYDSGGGGGALAYRNGVSVAPGEVLNVVVGNGGYGSSNGGPGGNSYIARADGTVLVSAGGGAGATTGGKGNGGVVVLGNGGAGGAGGTGNSSYGSIGGGGGAGGYSGPGGTGGGSVSSLNRAGSGGSGGGGGGGGYGYTSNNYYRGGGGGGVGLYGVGANGGAGQGFAGAPGGGGSGGALGVGASGGAYGGGGGGGFNATYSAGGGKHGAVRIIWGEGRSFPSNAN